MCINEWEDSITSILLPIISIIISPAGQAPGGGKKNIALVVAYAVTLRSNPVRYEVSSSTRLAVVVITDARNDGRTEWRTDARSNILGLCVYFRLCTCLILAT